MLTIKKQFSLISSTSSNTSSSRTPSPQKFEKIKGHIFHTNGITSYLVQHFCPQENIIKKNIQNFLEKSLQGFQNLEDEEILKHSFIITAQEVFKNNCWILFWEKEKEKIFFHIVISAPPECIHLYISCNFHTFKNNNLKEIVKKNICKKILQNNQTLNKLNIPKTLKKELEKKIKKILDIKKPKMLKKEIEEIIEKITKF